MALALVYLSICELSPLVFRVPMQPPFRKLLETGSNKADLLYSYLEEQKTKNKTGSEHSFTVCIYPYGKHLWRF